MSIHKPDGSTEHYLSAPEPIGYAFEPADYQALRRIEKALFGDGTKLTADQRRDLANAMHEVLEHAEKIQEAQPAASDSVQCPHCRFGFAPSAIKQHIAEKHS